MAFLVGVMVRLAESFLSIVLLTVKASLTRERWRSILTTGAACAFAPALTRGLIANLTFVPFPAAEGVTTTFPSPCGLSGLPSFPNRRGACVICFVLIGGGGGLFS